MTVSAAHHDPTAFDVREFARTAQGSLRDELDLAAIAGAPLPRDIERTLAALAALEGATMAHLRNVLVTSTHKDARVTAFLVTFVVRGLAIRLGWSLPVFRESTKRERWSIAPKDSARE